VSGRACDRSVSGKRVADLFIGYEIQRARGRVVAVFGWIEAAVQDVSGDAGGDATMKMSLRLSVEPVVTFEELSLS